MPASLMMYRDVPMQREFSSSQRSQGTNDPHRGFFLIFIHFLFLMKIMLWNCRGAGNDEFLCIIRDLIAMHDPMILVLVETKISGEKARTSFFFIL